MSYYGRQVQLTCEIPIGEIVLDFFDRLKSISRGYASMDYEFKEYRVSDVVKVDILINGDRVDALSIIVHRSNSTYRDREVAAKIREIIPRQMYDIAIQAAIGANVIVRENVKALRKNVLAKCYGGDISRKKKLLEKQKEGKKRMRQVGTIEIPQETFLAILRAEEKQSRHRSDNPSSMNFALILFVLVALTGIAWVADKLVFQRQRRAAATAALAEFDAHTQVQAQYGGGGDTGIARLQPAGDKLRQPWQLEYIASFFPAIAAVFLLRSFVIEPFKIPSGLMIPILQIGDFILVNKYTYGIRLPIVNKRIAELNEPQRSGVMVLRYPRDESMDYIERMIDVPGDVVKYDNKCLTVNGQPVIYAPQSDYLDGERLTYSRQYQETLGSVTHNILNNADRPAYVSGPDDFPPCENYTYNQTGFTCKVPAGHYFMMGDNRDNSADSRYWGFAPDKDIVGKTFFIRVNLGDLKRIGAFH